MDDNSRHLMKRIISEAYFLRFVYFVDEETNETNSLVYGEVF